MKSEYIPSRVHVSGVDAKDDENFRCTAAAAADFVGGTSFVVRGESRLAPGAVHTAHTLDWGSVNMARYRYRDREIN